jgi:cytochrome c peroxidase
MTIPRRRIGAILVLMLSAGALAAPNARVEFRWNLPRGLPVPVVPRDNPISADKIALGRRLFYDTRLSGNGTYACASCHQQARAFTDGRPRAIGSTGGIHARSAMTLTNVAYNATFGWANPALRTLEQQMAVPMYNEHPIELGLRGHDAEIVARLSGDAELTAWFGTAFPGESSPVTMGNIVKTIASFERTLLSAGSPFDRYLYYDDRSAMTPPAMRGKDLFFSSRLKCSECHATFNLSGPVVFAGMAAASPVFHNTGLYNIDGRGAYPAADRGLLDETRRARDMGRFRAPTLRSIAVTAPYMHDGSVGTLADASEHYAAGGVRSPFKSDRLKGFTLTEAQAADLIAFLESLTDQGFLTNPAFSDPRAFSSSAVPSVARDPRSRR